MAPISVGISTFCRGASWKSLGARVDPPKAIGGFCLHPLSFGFGLNVTSLGVP